jgi:hypothetical protein
MKPIINLTIALVSLMLLNIDSNAQWTNNPQSGMARISNEIGSEEHPEIVNLSVECYLILWCNFASTTGYYQIINNLGIKLLEPNGRSLINGTWWNGAIKFTVPDGQGGAICIFEDWRSGTRQIYGQRIDADGNRLWGENGLPIITNPNLYIGLKSVASDVQRNIFIGALTEGFPINSLCVQKINIEGVRLWGENGVIDCNNVSLCDWQKIVPDGVGGVIDIWQDNRHTGSPDPSELYAQNLDSTGTALWTTNGVMVRLPNGDQLYGDICNAIPDGRGGAIVSCLTGLTTAVYVFRLGDRGAVSWRWSHSAIGHYGWEQPLVLSPIDGMIWFSVYGWYSGNEHGNMSIFKFNPDTGQQLFGPNGILLGGQTITPVTGGMLITEWQYGGAVAPNTEARKVNNNGQLIWNVNWLENMGFDNFYFMDVTTDSADGVVIAFEDRRFPATMPDISAQRVLSNGRLGTPNPPSAKGTRPPPDLHLSVRPNPFNPTTTFTFTLPEAAKVTLEVFDIGGSKVRTQDFASLPAGSQSITFDGSDLPSGLYLYRLQAGENTVTGKMVLLK